MISLLLHESKAKLRMSVNNKDIIQMYLDYNWLITQMTLLINAFFMISNQGNVHLSKLLFATVIYSFDFSRVISAYCPRTDIYLSVLRLVISDISQYKTL